MCQQFGVLVFFDKSLHLNRNFKVCTFHKGENYHPKVKCNKAIFYLVQQNRKAQYHIIIYSQFLTHVSFSVFAHAYDGMSLTIHLLHQD